MDVINPKDIHRIIGERLFITLDHTLFSPIRLDDISTYIPGIGVGQAQFWTPLANKDNNNLSKTYGQIEAWTFLNAQSSVSFEGTGKFNINPVGNYSSACFAV